MDANKQLEEKELVFRIVGCAMEVLNELGHGLRLKPMSVLCAWNSNYRVYPILSRKFFPCSTKEKRLMIIFPI